MTLSTTIEEMTMLQEYQKNLELFISQVVDSGSFEEVKIPLLKRELERLELEISNNLNGDSTSYATVKFNSKMNNEIKYKRSVLFQS